MSERYPTETLDEDDDNGTMPENVATLAEAVVGHRIVGIEEDVAIPEEGGYHWGRSDTCLALTLDNGKRVYLIDTDDCCAYTELQGVLKHLDQIDHIITGVGTTEGYTKWHIYADMGDVLELSVGWSCGNPFYYGYGFDIRVLDATPRQAHRTDLGGERETSECASVAECRDPDGCAAPDVCFPPSGAEEGL